MGVVEIDSAWWGGRRGMIETAARLRRLPGLSAVFVEEQDWVALVLEDIVELTPSEVDRKPLGRL